MTSAVVPMERRPAPPSPKLHPILGASRRFQRDPLGYMLELVARHGPAVSYRFFLNWRGYIFVHPLHYEQILHHNYRNYTKLPHPTFQLLLPLLGKGLLSNDGESWLQRRRLAQPVFHRNRIDAFSQTMIAATAKRFDRWAGAARAGQPVAFDREMMELTLEIAGRTLFSVDLTGGDARRVGDIFNELNELFIKKATDPLALYTMQIPFWPSTRRVAQRIRALDSLIYAMIAQRRNAASLGDDLLAMLMAARDAETGIGMNEKELRDELLTLLIAGHETTALLMTWFFYCVAKHPEVEARLHDEVDRTLGGRLPTIEDLPKLTYTRQVIDETLRLYPPAYALSRAAHEADVIGGYALPPKAVVTLSPFITHRLEEFWPQPHRFDPERFTPENSADRPRFAYLPFGGGPRQCIGNGFALTEGVLVAAAIAQRFRLRIPDGYNAELAPQITLHPKGGMPLLFEARP